MGMEILVFLGQYFLFTKKAPPMMTGLVPFKLSYTYGLD